MSDPTLPKLDALVIAAHPDDAEISLGGTLLRLCDAGLAVGVLDLTRGELGSRGTSEERASEATAAGKILGLTLRHNLGLSDGRLVAGTEEREAVAGVLRASQPAIVLAHHEDDLHPDHVAAGRIAREGWYLSGLRRLAEQAGDRPTSRPAHLLRFMGHRDFRPTFIVNIDEVFDRKRALIEIYKSQFTPDSASDDGSHFLFGADILQRMESKARFFGEQIGAEWGEPLLHEGPFPLGRGAHPAWRTLMGSPGPSR